MANSSDNSELFEIFQNQVDLDDKNNEEEDSDEDREDEQADQNEGEDQQNTREVNRQKETSSRPEESAAAESDDQSPDTPDPSSPEARNHTPDAGKAPSEHKQQPPQPPSSGTVPPEDTETESETESHIQDPAQGKDLKGKIILSRGASVFLLMLAIVAVIGSYFIGLQTAANKQEVSTNQPVATEFQQQNKAQKTEPVPAEGTSETGSQQSTASDPGSDGGSSGIVPGQTYYTIALIAFPPDNNIQNYTAKHIEALKQQAGLNYVTTLQNLKGNQSHWIVVGYFESRDQAKRTAEKLQTRLQRTRYGDDYRTDIIDITAEQARVIHNS